MFCGSGAIETVAFKVDFRAVAKITVAPLDIAVEIPVFTLDIAAGIAAGKRQIAVVGVAEKSAVGGIRAATIKVAIRVLSMASRPKLSDSHST